MSGRTGGAGAEKSDAHRIVSLDPAASALAPARHDLSRHDLLAFAVLAVSAALLWVWPPAGVVMSVIVCGALAPWGRSLGERAIISTVVSTGTVAVVFAAMTSTGMTLQPIVWRLVVTGCVGLIAICVRLPRSAPVWPEVGVVDLVGLDTRLSILQYLHRTLGEKYRPCPLLEQYVAEGRLGRKVGRGVYDYPAEG